MQPVQLGLFEGPEAIFATVHRNLFPQKPVPVVRVHVRAYANANCSIRLEGGTLEVRMSDVLEEAPVEVYYALAHILLYKLHRRRPPREALALYRGWLNTGQMRGEVHRIRKVRGRKYLSGPQGDWWDLEPMFEALNARYFGGAMARPLLGWSRTKSRWLLGHFDPSHNAIVLSKVLDHPEVPRLAVEYVLFHEMLHLKYPAEHGETRRCVHTREFKEAEKSFERLKEAKEALKKL